MSEALKWDYISVEDYLAGEMRSDIRHEYRAGIVYAMAGGTNVHATISMNTTLSLGLKLRGKPCRPFGSDTKIRIQLPGELRFYYPDLSVVCVPNSSSEQFQDHPVVIVEVLSPSTFRTDLSEKKDAYLTIPSLQVYIVAESTNARVLVFRRDPNGGFVEETYEQLEAIIPLPEIDCELPLSELYETVEFDT